MPVGFPRRRGVTLIEAVLFISVALGLIVGGIVFFQQASLAQRTSDTVRLLSAMIVEVRGMEQNSDDFMTFMDIGPVLVEMNAIPSNAVLTGNLWCSMKGPWGGCIHILPGLMTATDKYIEMRLYGLPAKICARIAPFDSSGRGVIATNAEGVSILRDSNGPNIGGQQPALDNHWLSVHGALPPDRAGTLCSGLDGTENTYAAFGFSWH